MTIKHKIALLYTLLTAIVLVLFGIVVFNFALFYTTEEFFERLEQRARITAKSHFEKDDVDAQVYQEIREKDLNTLPEEKEYILKIPHNNAEIKDTPFLTKLIKEASKSEGRAYFRQNKLYGATLKYEDQNSDYLVVVTAKDIYGFNKLFYLKRTLIFTIILSLGFVYSLGYFYSVQLLRPINKLIANVQSIKASNLYQRLPVKPSRKDEINRLAKTFNDMLNRLETSFEIQNKFVGHASHEFKNPLTAILGEIEIALSKKRTSEDYYKSLLTIQEESQKLKNITLNLLRLSTINYDKEALQTRPVILYELIVDIWNTYNKNYTEGQLHFDLSQINDDPQLTIVSGNYDMLRIAFSNIIENSCKFSHKIRIGVSIYIEKKLIVTEITDQGIGIPKEDLPSIFQTFYRSENARPFSGHGIGLPLVQKIIDMHNGTINVNSNMREGTTFKIKIPLSSD